MHELSFSINSEYKNVPDACDKVKEYCMEKGLPEFEAVKVEICLDEALNNVIKHSYKEHPGNRIDLTLSASDGFIRIDIIDYGESRKTVVKKELEFDPNDIENLPESGMGLFIIERYMDQTKYLADKEKNVFSLFKKLNN